MSQGFPNLSAPLVGPSGGVTPPWLSFFRDLFAKTGGSGGGGGIGYTSGDIKPWPGPAIPSGWVTCDGRTINRVAYADLFAAISTTWGPGDGSTTFSIPDLRGRTLIGAGHGTGLSNRVLAATGGSETNTLLTGQLPAHSHPVTDPGHTHTAVVAASNATAGSAAGGAVAGNTGSAVTGLSVGNTGNGDPVNNMQPFAVVNWIIKT